MNRSLHHARVVSPCGPNSAEQPYFANTASVDGDAIAVSPSPFFDQASEDEALVATSTDKLYDFPNFYTTTPAPQTVVDVTSYTGGVTGAPVAVDFGYGDTAWFVTDQDWLVEVGTPKLGMIAAAHFNAGPPVAMAGAKSLTAGSLVVATGSGGGYGPQLNMFLNGYPKNPTTFPLPGDPIAMRITDDGGTQYAWVAIGTPPELIVINVGTKTQVGTPVSLPGVPLALNIGLMPGVPFPSTNGCLCSFPKEKSGFVHVAVAEP